MRKLSYLFILLLIFCFVSCAPESAPDQDDVIVREEIIIPTLTTEREPVSLSDITYARPDASALIEKTEEITAKINAGDFSFEEITSQIAELDAKYSTYNTMLKYITIMSAKDSSDSFISSELEYLNGASPSISRALEELFVAAATSEHALRFEAEVFGEGFIEEYADGSSYNDLAVALLEEEAALEGEYSSLSTATVKITYEGITDTYDNTVLRLGEKYKSNPMALSAAIKSCDALFSEAITKRSCEIFISLLRVRQKLAASLGYSSYLDYAYKSLGRDHSTEDFVGFMNDVSEYAVPIYAVLSEKAFSGYFKTHTSLGADDGKVINDLYKSFEKMNPDIAEAYSYMLNCGLFDISLPESNRLSGAFTTYLYDIDAPFIFATFGESLTDYMTLSHEFGHFYDAYSNHSLNASLDLLEVSSEALELLALLSLEEILPSAQYKYLFFSEMKSMLETIIFQAFYAKLEHLAYALPYEEISEERINQLVCEAAEFMNMNTRYINSLDDVIILHMIEEPFYVQSYSTSSIVALEIFFLELEKEGAGVSSYMALVKRDGKGGFEENLSSSSISSPFEEGAVMRLTNKIYYSILGSNYYSIIPAA